MYKRLMSSESLKFVSRAIEIFNKDLNCLTNKFWVCYGSFILNRQSDQSDLDLLCIHDNLESPRRVQAAFEGFPVTIYQISRRDFLKDGNKRKFGGYFSGKLLNPHVLFDASPEDERILYLAAGEFIGLFASVFASEYRGSQGRDEQLLVDSIFARLYLCPFYRSYLLSFFLIPEFPKLWEIMTEWITTSLLVAGEVDKSNEGFVYRATRNKSEVHDEFVMTVSRFWAIGTALHGGSADFPEVYANKSNATVDHLGLESLQSLMKFLEEKAGVKGVSQ